MYDSPCNNCENFEHCRPMIDMPMMNMPMENMSMMKEDDNEDLKMLYPEMHIKIFPMVAHHCDMIVANFGTMYCPSKIHIDHISEEICDKYEKYYRVNFDDDNSDEDYDMRQRRRRRPGRRNTIKDLVKILLIGELIGRRRGAPLYYNY
ncbi:hypothetical protein [Clostridium sp.]|uniref:hypothetical protein n=1 Tax=Clostridium sp. TaxID=1506 RepID=UPI003D6C8A2E